MKEIFVGEGCFGPIVRIDGESMHLGEYDERTDEDIDKMRMDIIQELINNRKNISLYDWSQIIEMIANASHWNLVSESNDSCDQCGNYNWDRTYEK
jgi:hypothetical protein